MPTIIPIIWLAIIVGGAAFFTHKIYRPRLMLSDPSKGKCRHHWIKADMFYRVMNKVILNGQPFNVKVFAYKFACIKCGAICSKDSVLEPELEHDYSSEKP